MQAVQAMHKVLISRINKNNPHTIGERATRTTVKIMNTKKGMMNPKVNKVSQCLKQQFVRECYKSRNKLLLAIQ